MSLVYPFRNNAFLYGASAKSEVINTVKSACIPEEQDALPQIISDWAGASRTFQELVQLEKGEAEAVEVEDIPQKYLSKTGLIEKDTLFKTSFSLLPYEIKLVEIDKLVAAQRAVNLDYVGALKNRLPSSPTIEDLIDFCLAPPTQVKPPMTQLLAENAISYTSDSVDFRFLGGFQKPLSREDIEACKPPGFPSAAIVLFVGFGAGPMNVLSYRGRLVLNNGFHRAYALREMSLSQIPVVVQKITNPDLEVPLMVANLPRDYVLEDPRPAMMKDFFNPKLVRKLRFKAMNKIVQVQWVASQFGLPIAG